MFRSRRRDVTPVAGGELGYHTEIAVVGDPDRPAIARQTMLFAEIGAGLRGYSGTVVGYDRGDPANSLTAVMPQPATETPMQAAARVGHIADAAKMAPTPQFADQAALDPALDPYQAQLFYRITR